MRFERDLAEIAKAAMTRALGPLGLEGELEPSLRRAQDPKHGDYQLNGVLPLAKTLKRPPRQLADAVALELKKEACFAEVEVAGPGFVNLRLAPAFLAASLSELARDAERDGVPTVEKRTRVVVDFSGPNVAKQMHVGHLRSTILGDALVKLMRFVGHEVVGDNHLGDWGTQFGLLIVGLRRYSDEAKLIEGGIAELERVYRLASSAAKEDKGLADEARQELAKLQAGDAENRALWERFVAITRKELDRVYARLGVSFDAWLGESAYNDALAGVVKMLVDKGIAREDQGALCIFFEDDPELAKIETPFIVQKKDGAFLYATTDIATVLYRRDHFHAERALYVVDQRQSLHFKQLFAVMRKLGVDMRLEHVGFGSVLGADGRPLKTRDGTNVTLESLLDEAETRALARIREEGLDVPEAEIAAVARTVGIGAVKYADLRQNRLSDYQFDWDKMLSFKGNAGPYLQYANARIRSIFRKGEVDRGGLREGRVGLGAAEERALAKELLRFADVVHEAAETGYPHVISDHLYAVARAFSAFYEACPVLKAEGAERDSRLVLCDLAARQLERGLGLLGIGAVDRM